MADLPKLTERSTFTKYHILLKELDYTFRIIDTLYDSYNKGSFEHRYQMVEVLKRHRDHLESFVLGDSNPIHRN